MAVQYDNGHVELALYANWHHLDSVLLEQLSTTHSMSYFVEY